jgi:DNA-binding transcriptional LysR family regulator
MSVRGLDIDLLRHFVTIVETGGFTAAGEVLGRTQSAVSLSVKRLEAVVGKRVFRRNCRTTELTIEGEVLLGFARRILELNDETLRRVQSPEVEGTLRLGIAEHFVGVHLPKILRGCFEEFPKVSIELKIGLSRDLLDRLDGGDFDLVLAKRERSSQRGRLLWREPLAWVAGPNYKVPAPDVSIPLAVLPAPCSYRQHAVSALGAVGRSWHVVGTSDTVAGTMAFVEAGVAISVVSRSLIPPHFRELERQEGFPNLPEAEVAVFGENTTSSSFARGLARALPAILASFQEDSLVPRAQRQRTK